VSVNRSRRKGRGIDAIFDSTDLSLAPPPTREQPVDEPAEERQRVSGDVQEPERVPESAETRERGVEVGGRSTLSAAGSVNYRRTARGPGRPRGQVSPGRELVQRGFYLEPEQDRMLDEIKASLKGRGFTPDRSAIARAALAHFGDLDASDQEELVRRFK